MRFPLPKFSLRFALIATVGVALLQSGPAAETTTAPTTPVERVRAKAQEVSEKQDEAWKIREQAWQGVLEPGKGRAVRLQLFRGQDYLVIFGTAAAEAIHLLAILDGENRIVARTEPSEAGEIATLQYSPEATGTYLVLLRADALTRAEPAAMVYAYR